MPPQITLHRGYDPHSRTLRAAWVTGLVAERISEVDSHRRKINEAAPACFAETFPPGVVQWFDFGLQPSHGSYVMVIAAGQPAFTKKYLVVDGEAYLTCHFFTIPMSWIPNVKAIGVLVAEVTFPGAYFPHIRHQVMTTDEDDVQWRRELNSRPKVHKALSRMLRA